jgi:hypothetical protein
VETRALEALDEGVEVGQSRRQLVVFEALRREGLAELGPASVLMRTSRIWASR